MEHLELKLYEVYINDKPGLTMTYLMARSYLIAYAFEWGKLLRSFDGKNNLQ